MRPQLFDQHIGSCLRRRVGVGGDQHVRLGMAALGDVAVDLVGADLDEQRPLERGLRADQLQQALHADEVRGAELEVARDGVVDVALGGEVDQDVALRQEVKARNVGILEPVLRVSLELALHHVVGRIADAVDILDRVAGAQRAANKVLSDEAESTGHDQHIGFVHSSIFPNCRRSPFCGFRR